MPFVKIDGRDLYYEVHGRGDPIVLLHHGFGSTEMWSPIYPAFTKAGYTVILYDRRGYGRSGEGNNFEEFYMSNRFRPECIRELDVLTESLGLQSFHLIGQCEGGVIAVDYAAEYPGKVKTLTTSSTQCYSDLPMAEFNAIKFSKAFHELEPEFQKKLILWHGQDRAETRYNLFRTYGGGYGIGFFDLRPVLQSVRCPTLVLYPDRSFIFDVEQGVSFYRSLPSGELAVLPKCGHNTYEQQPQEYIRVILHFLARHNEPC